MSRLHDLIGRRRIVTVEIIPDRVSPADLGLLRGRVDGVTVPALRNGSDDPVFPTGHHVSPQQRSIAAATLLRGTGVEAVPVLTCRDSSFEDVSRLSDLLGSGIENLLVLYGDPHLKPFKDRYEFKASHQLIDIVFQATKARLSLWGITNQYSADREREIRRTWLRQDAGARVILTNTVFEANGVLDYRDELRDAGLSVPLIAQISVIHSPDNLSFVSQKLGIPVPENVRERLRRDPESGVNIAVDAFHGLRSEFDGVHFSYLYRRQSPIPIYNRLLDLIGVRTIKERFEGLQIPLASTGADLR